MANYVNLMDVVYPVGSIYQTMNSTSPSSTIGGTWTQIKTFLMGSASSGKTGGEATHTLAVNEMPSHNHSICFSQAPTNLSLPSNVGNWYCFDRQWAWQKDGNNSPILNTGGGKHTTTCRHTPLALSGIAQPSLILGGVR